MTASFPIENEAPYGEKVQAYVDAGDAKLQQEIDNLPALGAGLLVAANNLADLLDIPASRSTLDVYSKEESDDNLTEALFPTANDVALVLVSDAIAATAPVMTLHSGSDLTLTSTPTVPTGLDGQEVVLLNTGTHNITLQDSGTLTGSDLALSVAALTLHPLESVTLRYSVAATVWVATAFSAKTGTGDMQGANNLSDVSSVSLARSNLGVPSAAQISALFGNNGGWTLGTSTDVYLPTPTIASGTIVGGGIRKISALHLQQGTSASPYTQTVEPTDISLGSPLIIEINSILNDTNSPFGPNSATTLYGPRALANIEGLAQIGKNQNTFAFSPIGFGDMLRVSNVPGTNRSIVPGWVIMSARTTYADAATVTIGGNDIAAGTAGFVDAQTFTTANSGILNGVANTYEIISVLSMPFIQGNSHVSRRTGFKVNDLNQYLGTPGSSLSLGSYVSGADSGVGSVDEQYGVYIPHLTQALNQNIGIYNASATVESPLAVSITAVGNTLPATATILAVTASSALTLTSTPTIPAGLDGQRLRIVNVGANIFGLKDESTLTGSNLLISSMNGKVLLSQNESIDLIYSNSAAKWLKQAVSKPLSTLSGPVTFWDGTNTHGKITFDATTFFGNMLSSVNVFADASHTTPVIALFNENGFGSIQLGPGGMAAVDLSITRDGTAHATAVGTFVFPGLVPGVDTAPLDSSGAAVSAYTSPPRSVSYDFRAGRLGIANSGSTRYIEVIVGDSMESYNSSAPETTAWPAVYEAHLARRYNTLERTAGFLVPDVPLNLPYPRGIHWDTVQGTPINRGLGGNGSSLAAGQKNEVTRMCDGFDVYRTDQRVNGATMQVKIDGVQVDSFTTTDGTIASSPGYNSGRRKTYACSSYGSHTLTITNTDVSNTIIVDACYVTASNRTTGVQVHRGGHQAWGMTDFVSGTNPSTLQHIANVLPNVVTFALGHNDAAATLHNVASGAYAALLTSWVTAVQTASPLSAIRYIHQPATALTPTGWSTVYRSIARATCATLGVQFLDWHEVIGDYVTGSDPYSISADHIHPGDMGHAAMANTVISATEIGTPSASKVGARFTTLQSLPVGSDGYTWGISNDGSASVGLKIFDPTGTALGFVGSLVGTFGLYSPSTAAKIRMDSNSLVRIEPELDVRGFVGGGSIRMLDAGSSSPGIQIRGTLTDTNYDVYVGMIAGIPGIFIGDTTTDSGTDTAWVRKGSDLIGGSSIWLNAKNISTDTTTGSKIGLSTTQKIGLWNTTPVVQYSTTGTSTGFSAATGTAVLSASTFTGNTGSTAYTISDIVRALKLMGVLAA